MSEIAGDKNTKALSEALRQRLSTSKEEERPLPPQDSPRAPEHMEGATEFEMAVRIQLLDQDLDLILLA